MPIKNYTTVIPVKSSISTIQESLAKGGASAVMIEYDPHGQVSVLSFKLKLPHGDVSFRLPGRTDGVLLTLQRQSVEPRYRTREHAARVGWKIVSDWVLAQLAMVQAEQAEMAEVFLPYADAGNGITLYQRMKSNPGNLLGYKPD